MAKILLAEDDQSMMHFLIIALERAGHSIDARENGLQAIEALKNNDEGYDLLLTDIVMPGMDGIELAQKATTIQPDIKVMFITGFAAMAVEADKGSTSDTSQVLSKPFHLNDLVQQVEDLLAA